jgi:small subunit ribosomal protein S3
MGQKVHPIGLRLGVIEDWRSKWFEEKNYAKWLHEDLKIRAHVREKYKQAGISRVEIKRSWKKAEVSVHSAKPGVLIGKKGQGVDQLKLELQKLTSSNVMLNIVEVRKAELDAQLVAENVAQQMERRVSFRRAMKKAVTTTMRLGAKGIRINCAGRLGGAEMSRREWYLEGRVPLHTLRANIDYGFSEAKTTFGVIGVKVWIFKGEVLDKQTKVG